MASKKKAPKKALGRKSMKATKGGATHSGGINVCMADGSVRFVSDGVSTLSTDQKLIQG